MQGELLERFADTQTALIAALDAGDTEAMIAHTRDLGGITDALRTQGVLRGHVERRVAAIQGEQTVATYTGRPARR